LNLPRDGIIIASHHFVSSPWMGGFTMDKLAVSVSAFDCDVLRSAFKSSVFEDSIPEDEWREYAAQMIRDFTGIETVDTDLVEWIVRSSQNARVGAYSAHEAASSS
jgi:hypothetical protein